MSFDLAPWGLWAKATVIVERSVELPTAVGCVTVKLMAHSSWLMAHS